MTEKFIDIRKLIAAKNKNVLGWTPGFLIRYIERIIHQDDINRFMSLHKGANAVEFSDAVMKEFNINVNIIGKENIPDVSEGCIFVGNHPLGGFDAIAIVPELKEIRPNIKFIVNDFLLSVKNLQEIFVGVNKVGKNAMASLQAVEAQFASDWATFIFPAGLVSRRQKGVIKDLEWKKTFITKAKKYNKSVVPVYIEGRLSNRFYRLANIRKWLGIKFNIEMLYLVDELYKQKNRSIRVVIGEPIAATTFDKSKTNQQWADWVKEKVYQFRED